MSSDLSSFACLPSLSYLPVRGMVPVVLPNRPGAPCAPW